MEYSINRAIHAKCAHIHAFVLTPQPHVAACCVSSETCSQISLGEFWEFKIGERKIKRVGRKTARSSTLWKLRVENSCCHLWLLLWLSDHLQHKSILLCKMYCDLCSIHRDYNNQPSFLSTTTSQCGPDLTSANICRSVKALLLARQSTELWLSQTEKPFFFLLWHLVKQRSNQTPCLTRGKSSPWVNLWQQEFSSRNIAVWDQDLTVLSVICNYNISVLTWLFMMMCVSDQWFISDKRFFFRCCAWVLSSKKSQHFVIRLLTDGTIEKINDYLVWIRHRGQWLATAAKV